MPWKPVAVVASRALSDKKQFFNSAMVVEACKVDTYYPAPCPKFTIFSKIYYILQRAISVTRRTGGEGSELGRMKIGKEPGVSKDRSRGLRGRE